jgi:type III restriction enzyme
MELKSYQKRVINDLNDFLAILSEKQNIRQAYNLLWEQKGISVCDDGMPPYNAVLQGVPHVCFKVPTGGGKTYIAANSIKPIFDSMPHIHIKAVVWLVPSDAILRQTISNLNNTEHPYRQAIDVGFGGNVEIYTKQQLLNGQNFNPTSVADNLSVFILTYDSFRTNNKDGRKAYKQNGTLMSFKNFMNDNDILLEDVDETALIQIIRKLNPVVIVDESHHATSKLSIEMLKNFNPSFVLELTATPRENSNIISVVKARELKSAHMVKLPVIVYNQQRQEDVFLSAISLRNRLEIEAAKSEEKTGKYIRPIVLLQAQPNISEESTTYEKIRNTLIDIGIPREQIAVKTGDKDEIKDTDLLSCNCPIRYIITVSALKEGWDCPFAYILATVANRSSQVDVEQILGRILRLPYTSENSYTELNLSYVITSSNDFYTTLDKIVVGLNNAGFSQKDYRISDVNDDKKPSYEDVETQQMWLSDGVTEIDNLGDETYEVNIDEIKSRLGDSNYSDNREQNDDISEKIRTSSDDIADIMIEKAKTENTFYCEDSDNNNEQFLDVPDGMADKMKVYRVNEEFREEIKSLILPQFVIENGYGFLSEQRYELLDKENLCENFRLRDKDTQIDFDSIDAEIAKIDVSDSSEIPKAWKLSGFENETVKEWFDSRPTESKRRLCLDIICKRLLKNNILYDKDVREYVGHIMSYMTESQLNDLEKIPNVYADKIKKKINRLLADYRVAIFYKWVEQERIQCQPMYKFFDSISPLHTISSIPKSLYEAEDGNINDYERRVIWELANMDNVKWWHRNISKREFAINGAVPAYPDFIVKLESGKILMVETKGDYLDNDEARAKAKEGFTWANMSGKDYKYYMVLETKTPIGQGQYSHDDFLDIVKHL